MSLKRKLEDLLQCAICFDTMKEPAGLTCGHFFCSKCIEQSRKRNRACPMCRDRGKVVSRDRMLAKVCRLLAELEEDEDDVVFVGVEVGEAIDMIDLS